MKTLLGIICILLAASLWLQIVARPTRGTNASTVSAFAPNASSSAAPSAPVRPPIIAKSNVLHYGPEDAGYVGFEGKIYNPNSVGVTSVIVRYHVYTPASEAAAKQFNSVHLTDNDCSTDFAYIPPHTTYDFQTNRITARTPELLNGIGLYPDSVRIDLTPKITFEAETPK